MIVLKFTNGCNLLLSHVESKSVALSIMPRFGTVDEERKYNGIAHFLEHVAFNGPKHISKKEISARIEQVGGELNAVTNHAYTHFYAEVLAKYFNRAFNTLKQICLEAEFDRKEVELERKIIMSEIHYNYENPDYYIVDMLYSALFPKHKCGMPVLGTENSIRNINEKILRRYYKKFYRVSNFWIALSGNFKQKDAAMLIEAAGKKEKKIKRSRLRLPKQKFFSVKEERNIQQSYLALGVKTPNALQNCFEIYLINAILGASGLSSKLVSIIREKYGLAYSIYSHAEVNSIYGCFYVILSTKPQKLEKAKKLVLKEWKNLQNGVRKKDLENAKKFIEGHLLLKSSEPLEKNKIMLFLHEHDLMLPEFLQKIQEISAYDVSKAAEEFLSVDEYSEAAILAKKI